MVDGNHPPTVCITLCSVVADCVIIIILIIQFGPGASETEPVVFLSETEGSFPFVSVFWGDSGPLCLALTDCRSVRALSWNLDVKMKV